MTPGTGLPWPESIRAAIGAMGIAHWSRRLRVRPKTIEYWPRSRQPQGKHRGRLMAELGWGELEVRPEGWVPELNAAALTSKESHGLYALGEFLGGEAAKIHGRPVTAFNELPEWEQRDRERKYQSRLKAGKSLFPHLKLAW